MGDQLAILRGLQGKPVYGGTVDPVTVAERRAANRLLAGSGASTDCETGSARS